MVHEKTMYHMTWSIRKGIDIQLSDSFKSTNSSDVYDLFTAITNKMIDQGYVTDYFNESDTTFRKMSRRTEGLVFTFTISVEKEVIK